MFQLVEYFKQSSEDVNDQIDKKNSKSKNKSDKDDIETSKLIVLYIYNDEK